MTIETHCTQCQRPLRLKPELAGKRIKCPQCKAVVLVPEPSATPAAPPPGPATVAAAPAPSPAPVASPKTGAPVAVAPQPAVSATPTAPVARAIATPPASSPPASSPPQVPAAAASGPAKPKDAPKPPTPHWHLKTEDGEMYGPVPRTELDDWVAQGRITADCQLLLDGADQWQWATDVYPDLAEEEAEPEPPPPAPTAPAPATASAKASGGPRAGEVAAATGIATGSAGRVRSSWRDEPPRPTPSRATTAPEYAAEAPDESETSDASEADDEDSTSDRRWITAFLLAFFLGWLGIHRFYLGRVLTGVAMLFTGGGLLIWQIVDVVSIALERLPDHLGRPLRK